MKRKIAETNKVKTILEEIINMKTYVENITNKNLSLSSGVFIKPHETKPITEDIEKFISRLDISNLIKNKKIRIKEYKSFRELMAEKDAEIRSLKKEIKSLKKNLKKVKSGTGVLNKSLNKISNLLSQEAKETSEDKKLFWLKQIIKENIGIQKNRKGTL